MYAELEKLEDKDDSSDSSSYTASSSSEEEEAEIDLHTKKEDRFEDEHTTPTKRAKKEQEEPQPSTSKEHQPRQQITVHVNKQQQQQQQQDLRQHIEVQRSGKVYSASEAAMIRRARERLYYKRADFERRYKQRSHTDCCGTPRQKPCLNWNLGSCNLREGHEDEKGITQIHVCGECLTLLFFEDSHKPTCAHCPCREFLCYGKKNEMA